jgi:hypothetical protein
MGDSGGGGVLYMKGSALSEVTLMETVSEANMELFEE